VRVRVGRACVLCLSLGWAAPVGAQPAAPAPEKPPEKPADKPAEKPAEKPADKSPDKLPEKTAIPEPPSFDARLKALEVDLLDVKDENEDLKSEVADLKERQAAQRMPNIPGAMNPAITAFLNGAGRVDSKTVLAPDGTEINDRMFVRTGEFDLRAAVDPYADAVAIVSLEKQPSGGFDVDLEEGYVVIKRLPILESAPLGLKLTAGRYRAPLGAGNKTHMHDLPWTTRPLPIALYLGTENGPFFESGFNPEGVDAEVLLPEIIPGAVMELSGDVVDGGDIGISGGGHPPGFVGHYNLFFTLADAHDFNLGVSGYTERGHEPASVLGADFLYKWKPIAAGEFHSVVLGGEVFYVDRQFRLDTNGDGTPDAEATAKPFGAYGFAQYQLNWHVYAGVRYDYAQEPTDDRLATQLAAAYLSYYTSEFLRFRAGYEHRCSEVPTEDGLDTFIGEVNVVFGSHPTEPYWVNR
jgi:hypothetical protein